MITFERKRQILKPADCIQRKAHSVFPHVSNSRFQTWHNVKYMESNYRKKMIQSLRQERDAMYNSDDKTTAIINTLVNGILGNCFEEAKLAELIAKINGQKNVITGRVIVNDGISKKRFDTKHRVAIITKIPLNDGIYTFKNKDAIVIDPWLGAADFAEGYFTKLKSIYSENFENIPKISGIVKIIKQVSKSFSEFSRLYKKEVPHIGFSVVTMQDKSLTDEKIAYFRKKFPQLIIDNYKSIKL